MSLKLDWKAQNTVISFSDTLAQLRPWSWLLNFTNTAQGSEERKLLSVAKQAGAFNGGVIES